MVVTNKARVELERAPDQRFDLGNEVFGDTSTSEKDLGDVALRVIERIDANG